MPEKENIVDKIKENEVPTEDQPSPKTKDITDKLTERKEEGSELEQKTEKGFFGMLKKFSLWDWMKIGTTGLAVTALSGGFLTAGAIVNVATTTASYAVGTYLAKRKEGMASDELKSEFYLGGVMTPVLYNVFKVIDGVANPILKTAGGLGIAIPIFNFFFLGVRHFIKNYNPIDKPLEFLKRITYKKGGLITLPFELYNKGVKGQYKKSLLGTWKYLGLPMALVWNFVPLAYMLPVTAVTRTAYKYILEKSTGDNKQTQYSKSNEIPQNRLQYNT